MFGLLTYKKVTLEQYSQFRLNYCGNCKTIGKIYGQKERLFLNFDTVFLSELLDTLSNDNSKFKHIKPNTCFSLPQNINQIPFFLKYTASVNVLLACYKIIDNVVDSRTKINIWRAFKFVEKRNFKKAKNFLKQSGVSINLIEENIQTQFAIEKDKNIFSNYNETFNHYCTPTGIITEEIFRASVIHLDNEALQNAFKIIGKNYGEIVYLIDALEDYNQDRKKGRFNCLLLDKQFTIEHKINLVSKYINNSFEKLKIQIESLPIQNAEKVSFCERISINIYKRLNEATGSEIRCAKRKFAIKERYRSALEVAKKFYFGKSYKILRRILYPAFAFTLICFFILLPAVAHAQVHEAGCCGSWCCPCTGQKGANQTVDKACECCNDCSNSNNKNDSECAPLCLSLIGLGVFCNFCCGGSGGGEGPKVITITKIIEVDKGSGCCK
jgi:Family of unknown function (DUF5685)